MKPNYNEVSEIYEVMDAAFKLLRKEGYYARKAFSCCGSCGSYELAENIKDRYVKTNKLMKGGIFYSTQSRTSVEDYGGVYLNFGGNNELNWDEVRSEHGVRPTEDQLNDTLAAGNALINCIAKAIDQTGHTDVVAQWDGSEDQCVYLTHENCIERDASSRSWDKFRDVRYRELDDMFDENPDHVRAMVQALENEFDFGEFVDKIAVTHFTLHREGTGNFTDYCNYGYKEQVDVMNVCKVEWALGLFNSDELHDRYSNAIARVLGETSKPDATIEDMILLLTC